VPEDALLAVQRRDGPRWLRDCDNDDDDESLTDGVLKPVSLTNLVIQLFSTLQHSRAAFTIEQIFSVQ